MNSNLRYCSRCCLPETAEGIEFDERGICKTCISIEQKRDIDWEERERELRELLKHYKARSEGNYDCIVPISGGKDSTFQLHVLVKVYGMKPLAVTFSHNWFSETGKYNLQNALEKFNVDHIMFTPNRALVNKLAKQGLYKIGDPCWHCHAGVGAFPLQVAVKFNIPLLVWGEGPQENGRATYNNPRKYDANHFRDNSSKVSADDMINDNISLRDLGCFINPSDEKIKKVRVTGIFLGDYIFWDTEKQVEFIKKEYGWKEAEVEGTYKRHKSVECIMEGVHSYAKFIKRGFGRATNHASSDVRNNLLTRDKGFELINKYDGQRPKIMDYYLKIAGLTEKEFVQTCKSLRRGKAKDLP